MSRGFDLDFFADFGGYRYPCQGNRFLWLVCGIRTPCTSVCPPDSGYCQFKVQNHWYADGFGLLDIEEAEKGVRTIMVFNKRRGHERQF